MNYRELLRIIGSNTARDCIYSILIQAGRADLIPEYISKEQRIKLSKGVNINEKDCQLNDWKELRDEISENIRHCNGDYAQLKRYICPLISPFEDIAPYYDLEGSYETAIILSLIEDKQFPCDEEMAPWIEIAEAKADDYCEKLLEKRKAEYPEGDPRRYVTDTDFEDAYIRFLDEESEKYAQQWISPEAIMSAKIHFGLVQLAFIIQGALLENNARYNIFDFQDECGVTLVRKVAPDNLVTAMDWTEKLAKSYLKKPIYSDTPKAQWSDFPELVHANKASIIDDNGRLKVSMADFVRFCRDNKYFGNLQLNDWKPIDQILTNKKGKPIKADDLKQSYQDIQKTEIYPLYQ